MPHIRSKTQRGDNFSPGDLHQRVRGGTRAVIAAQVISQLISLTVLAALYRLVQPADFGLLGMAVPLVLLLRTCAALGLNAAAVQRQGLSSAQLTSLFWINLTIALATALLIAASGPLLAMAYQTPAVSAVCASLAATSIVAAIGAQHQTLLERKLLIGRLAIARLAAQAAGGAAGITAALAGWGVWALIVQQYAELVVLDAAVWLIEPWRPAAPWRLEPVGDLLRFGGYYSLSNLMFTLAQNLDKVLLAWLLGGTPSGRAVLGMYTQAFNLMLKPVYFVTTPIASIMLPALSRAAGDRDAFAEMVQSFYRMVAIVLLPCGVGLYVVAPDAMLVLGGEKWLDAGILLMALAPAIIAQGFINIASFVFAAAGRVNRLFAGTLMLAILYAQAYGVGYWLGGLVYPPPLGGALGIAWSYSITTVLVVLLPYQTYCLLCVGVSPISVLTPLRGAALASACMGLIVWALHGLLLHGPSTPPAMRLAIVLAAGVAIYALIARRDLRWLIQQLVGTNHGGTPSDPESCSSI